MASDIHSHHVAAFAALLCDESGEHPHLRAAQFLHSAADFFAAAVERGYNAAARSSMRRPLEQLLLSLSPALQWEPLGQYTSPRVSHFDGFSAAVVEGTLVHCCSVRQIEIVYAWDDEAQATYDRITALEADGAAHDPLATLDLSQLSKHANAMKDRVLASDLCETFNSVRHCPSRLVSSPRLPPHTLIDAHPSPNGTLGARLLVRRAANQGSGTAC